MQNDHKGRVAHDICGHTLESFYASGQRGPEVRADGRGGSLARGYYAAHAGGKVGPFNTRSAAVEAGITSLNEYINGPQDADASQGDSNVTLTIRDADGRIVGEPETFEDDGTVSVQDLLRQRALHLVAVGQVELRRGGELVATGRYVRGKGLIQTGTLASE